MIWKMAVLDGDRLIVCFFFVLVWLTARNVYAADYGRTSFGQMNPGYPAVL